MDIHGDARPLGVPSIVTEALNTRGLSVWKNRIGVRSLQTGDTFSGAVRSSFVRPELANPQVRRVRGRRHDAVER